MQDAEIKTSVNLALNHNDVVEMMLNEQLELKETQLEKLSEEFKLETELYNTVKRNLELNIVKTSGVHNTKDYKKFKKVVADLGLTVVSEPSVTFKKENIGKVEFWNLGQYAEFRSPITRLKKAMREHYINTRQHYKDVPEIINVAFVAKLEDANGFILSLKAPSITSLKITSAASKLIDQLHELSMGILELDKKIVALELEHFMLEHDNAKAKSKFIKGMLNNSKTGKELVALIEGIQGQSLIGSK